MSILQLFLLILGLVLILVAAFRIAIWRVELLALGLFFVLVAVFLIPAIAAGVHA